VHASAPCFDVDRFDDRYLMSDGKTCDAEIHIARPSVGKLDQRSPYQKSTKATNENHCPICAVSHFMAAFTTVSWSASSDEISEATADVSTLRSSSDARTATLNVRGKADGGHRGTTIVRRE